jgi:integrase
VMTRSLISPRDALADAAVQSLSSTHSRRIYRGHIVRFLASGLSLTREGIQRFMRDIESRCGPVSVNHALSAVRLLAREAFARGQIDSQNMQAISSIRGVARRGVRLGNWLDIGGLREMLRAAERGPHGVRNAAILAVLAGCGLRRAEVVSLRWGQYQTRAGRAVWIDIVGKGKRSRSVPIAQWVVRYLDVYRDSLAKLGDGLALISTDTPTGLVFGGLGEQGVYYLVRDAAKAAGLPSVAPHDLRRTYSKLARAGGCPIEQIQVTLGHAEISTTQRYLGTELELEPGKAAGDYVQGL